MILYASGESYPAIVPAAILISGTVSSGSVACLANPLYLPWLWNQRKTLLDWKWRFYGHGHDSQN